jgi:hypothetical protein
MNDKTSRGGQAQSPVRYCPGPDDRITASAYPERPGRSEMVTFSDRVVVPSYVLVRHLDGESVLLNLETEKYFGLDGTGTRIWEIATHSPTIEAAYGKLSEEFEVEPDVLRSHLSELLGQLVDNGLLKVMPADVESIRAI